MYSLSLSFILFFPSFLWRINSLPFGSDLDLVANFSARPSLISLNEQITHPAIRFAVSIHENTVFLGCACANSAYAYHRKNLNSPWEIQQKFSPLTVNETDFGLDVGVSIDRYNAPLRIAIVGSPSYNNDAGAVYLFREISPGNWIYVNMISPGSPGDRFGTAIVLDKNNQLAVGAPNRTSQGLVYVYSILLDYSFALRTTLQSPFSPPSGRVRTGCALIGSDDIVNTVLIVGACPTFSSIGVAAVYFNFLMISRTASEIPVGGDFFGPSLVSLALTSRFDGFNTAPSWLVLGQPFDKGIGTVTVYQVVIKGATITLNTVILEPKDGQSGDRYGTSVSLYDNVTNLVLIVGAPGRENMGAVYVYHRPSMPGDDDAIIDWKFVAKLKPPSSYGPGILDFGLKCAYDNGVLAVGATRQNSVNNFTPIGVIMDVALVTGDTDRSPTFAPTYEKHISSEQSSQSPITGTVLAIFIPVIAVIFGIIATIGYILFRHKGDLSRTFSYDRSNVIYIPRKQAKQIHCEPDPLTNLEAGMESLKKARWIIQPSQLTIPVAPNLGSGGYGVVKRGIYRDGRRKYDVAVKILLDRHVNSDEFRRVLLREAALMVELRSPYIVEVYGVCESKMLVLELMNYGSLYTLLETVEPTSFPLQLRIQLMIDSIRGIEYLHDSDVIHADMKSLNILLCTEGGSLKAKISDFGLSRIMMGDGCESTNTNQISIRWAAPEMLQDRPKISKSIDIYAFGIVMWEILALKRPYADMNLAPLIQKVTSGGREPMPDNTPPIIGELISKCWAQYPESRPKAATVRETLMTFQETFETAGESILDPSP